MKKLRSGLEIKKCIIKLLKLKKELSFRRLDIKLNTANKTIKMHCKELEYLKVVKLLKHKHHERNMREYTTVKLTNYGETL